MSLVIAYKGKGFSVIGTDMQYTMSSPRGRTRFQEEKFRRTSNGDHGIACAASSLQQQAAQEIFSLPLDDILSREVRSYRTSGWLSLLIAVPGPADLFFGCRQAVSYHTPQQLANGEAMHFGHYDGPVNLRCNTDDPEAIAQTMIGETLRIGNQDDTISGAAAYVVNHGVRRVVYLPMQSGCSRDPAHPAVPGHP